MKEYLFVCGCARSGTSVLRKLLVAHPKVVIGLERYINLYRSKGKLTPDLFEKERFLNLQTGDTFYQSLDHFPEAYSGFKERYENATFFGDKIPLLYRGYDAIFTEFPQARVIFISRTLEDVAVSFKRRANDPSDKTWGAKRGVEAAIEEWNAAHRLTVQALEKYPRRILVVNYEIMFGTWVGVREMFNFLELDLPIEVRHEVSRLKEGNLRKKTDKTTSLSVSERLSIWQRMNLQAWREVNRDWLVPEGRYATLQPLSPPHIEKIVCLIGLPRSGTTVMAAVLDAHSRVFYGL
ncbi:hypothetical protein DO97_04800 [Neosynechococcus sphagnicola sy1]|uniref:Sulfotransferase n=1 Tax=Neosynechococcus sphagnicola sy1 TaxID=1497020 RepID=A0A098TKI3_9CYAN|nr:hypothetical protein DO97_04800 [Neosynechococcus sphagnicola sy1]